MRVGLLETGQGLREEKGGWDWGSGDGPGGPASLTIFPVEALDQGGAQGLVGDLAGIDIMSFVGFFGQRQGAAEAVGVVLAVLLHPTALDATGYGKTIHFPVDSDSTGVEAIHQAHDRGISKV